MGLHSAAEESSDFTTGKDDERRKDGYQKGGQKGGQKGDQKGGEKNDQKGSQKGHQKNGQKGGQKSGQKNDQKGGQAGDPEGYQKSGQKDHQKDHPKNNRQGDDRENEAKVAQGMRTHSRQGHRVKPPGGTTTRVENPNKTHFTEKAKKHYLDNVDKTLQKSNIDCVSYVYKNMNDQATCSKSVANSLKFGGREGRVDAVRQMLLFEKRPKKNVTIGASRSRAATGGDGPCAKDDETVQSIIYSTFINTKLRQTHKHATETVSRKPPKGKLAKQVPDGKNKKGNHTNSGQGSFAKRSEVYLDGTNQTVHAYRQNLTSAVTETVCTDKCVQITESNEELKNLKNDGTFLYEQVISERERKKKRITLKRVPSTTRKK